MTAQNLDPKTRNDDIGIYPAKSRLAYDGVIAADVHIGTVATWIRALTAGWVVYHNPLSNEDGIEYLEAGEKAPLCFDIIYLNKTIDGKATTAQTVIWYSTPQIFMNVYNQ